MCFTGEGKLTQGTGEKKVEVDFIGTSISFSQGLDYAQQGIMNHHLRVSLLSLYIGQALKLGEEEMFQDLGCRIVAVSDIFTALREERPYRAGLSWESIERIMLQQVKGSGLDRDIAALLFDNKDLIDDRWEELTEKLHA